MSAPFPVSPLSWDTPLVGRHADLARLAALLDAPPALAVVRGEPGTGRSTLVAALKDAAGAAGWLTVGPLDVRTATGRDGFERALRGASGRSDTTTDTPGPDPLHRDTSAAHVAAEQARSTPAVAGAASPTLVLLDDYQGDHEVEQTIVRELDRMDVDAQVVTVIAGTAPRVAVFVDAAAAVVDTRLPTVAEVRTHLAELGRLLDPPLVGSELDVLAAEAAGAPHLIHSLVRALSYGRPDA